MCKYIFLMILFLLTLFPIKFVFLPQDVWKVLYAVVPCIYIVFNYKIFLIIINQCFKNRCFIYSIVFLFSFYIYTLANIILQNGDISYYTMLLSIIFNCLKFIALYIFMIKNRMTSIEYFSKMYIYCVVFYVICSIVMLVDLDIRYSWQNLIWNSWNGRSVIDIVNEGGSYVSRYGLQGYSGYFCTMICTSTIFVYIITQISTKNNFGIKYSIVFVLIGNMFYGRIGIVLTLIGILYTLIFIERKSYFNLFMYSIVIFFILNLLYQIISETEYSYWLIWMLEPVNDFITGLHNGYLGLGSSNDKLLDMYFIPDDNTIFWGDAIYTNSDDSFYCHTDSGFMRNMLFNGIVGSSLFYISFLYMIKSVSKDIKSFIIIALIAYLFELKGGVGHYLYALIMILSIVNIYNSNWREDV